ncbi:DUF7619 domain-containing protein [Flavobacterium wongokense]|uniref:DUF7619 domain-containing protein n=1 Tax=Flavobacterium wongokense TaxID=2910674 RepID=UPI001F2B9C5A|nr:T9SS type A sorting domain-containing protein [Flavobacterium sp. WG47]MCF6131277.1 T9SS type A sorting domain-containing protein [Flavobacterium sp. WG47]
MKKLYALLFVAFIGFAGNAQIVTIQNANFRAVLMSSSTFNGVARNASGASIRIDANFDGQFQLSEILAVYGLEIVNASITDFSDVQYFTNLRKLNCSANLLTSLNVTMLPNLTQLYCDSNQLTSIDLSGNPNLNDFQCIANQITSLDLSHTPSIAKISCGMNQLTSLNISNLTNLFLLDFRNNQIATIDAGNFSNLRFLYGSDNVLTSLNVSNSTGLWYIQCQNNQLSTLAVAGLPDLTVLNCENNNLQTLAVSNLPRLERFTCFNNQLTSLNLNSLPMLGALDCSHNQLSHLDISQNPSLDELDFSYNQLTEFSSASNGIFYSFNCSHNNLLKYLLLKNTIYINEDDFDFSNNPSLEYICIDENADSFIPIMNKITEYGYTNTCNVNSYCSFVPGGTYYVMNGTNKYDQNNNGCDALDYIYPNLRYNITNGTTSGSIITNASGGYSIPLVSGTYTVTPIIENPSYFSVSPTTVNVNFPTQASPLTQNFCVSPIGSHPDVEITMIPTNDARPGFDAEYRIVYKNKGNLMQSGTISLNFDDAVLDFVEASQTVSSQSANNLVWDFTNLQLFETRTITVKFNINTTMETPAVNAGDVLHYTANIAIATDENSNDNTVRVNQIVINSHDPNDKTCLEGPIVSSSMVGQYVHYVIRFENTGTASAVNIVVKDIVDTNKFDISTLVPLNGSHQFVTRILNTNQVEFIFENINLPFDDVHNDGFVAFKIKTKPTLVIGDTFSNGANIYFDYNFPVTTNTYTTTVATLGNSDFDFNNVFSLSPVPTKNRLTITVKQDVEMSSISIYNNLGQLVQVVTNPTKTIDVSGLKPGTYFIKIISDKGTATTKFIKE